MSPSPRSSIDAVTHSPSSSAFLHNLSSRLRKGSSASRASSQSSEATHSNADHLERPETAQSTKRYVLSVLRDDWEYPTTQAHKGDLKVQREATSYRLRDESVSEYESSPSKSKKEDPYRFDNPDDVGVAIERRKARKRRLLEQEMSWNEGLRIWTMRRDAWTGAVAHKPRQKSNESAPSSGRSKKRWSREDRHERTSSDSTGHSLSSAPSWPQPTPQLAQDSMSSIDEPGTHANAEDLPDGPYLPIYPPLFPASHTLRARIKPTAYPTIYSKVVIQSLAPNVPIPLNHMINALVEGWKSEGNWPPQPMALEQPAGRRKAKKAESAFSRWKREQEERRNGAVSRAQALEHGHEDDQKGVRSQISGAVRKLLGGGKEEVDVDRDLMKMGLTFETDEERLEELNNAYQQQDG
ncbi:hypothetical protein H2198_002132 [Neophaeococcomyces mojaviensis]|uniref:Uncharacterized protein n=1 Tax=Neophaeococcomyces mojaviensis TaxID=3383035 RepID=A0ACC3AFD6_9EURO|nr:hypothetical protein H2198_002132 [Knufia sp. JES_112]